MTDADWRNGRTRDELLAMVEYIQSRWDERQGWLFGAAVMRRIWDLLTDERFRDLVVAVEGRAAGIVTEAEFTAVRQRLPQATNWRPPEPSPLLWEPQRPRAGYLGGLGFEVPPPGVINFRELPYWVRQTHHATVNLGELNFRGVVVYAADARADHTAEQSAEWKPIDDQIAAINRETGRFQREYDDAVWRGMSSAEQRGEALTQRREQADVQIRELRAEQYAIRTRIADTARTGEFAAQADLLRCIAGNPFRPVAFDPSWRTEMVASLARGIVADRAFDRLPILADALEEAGCDHIDALSHCRSSGPHAMGCWALTGLLRSYSDTHRPLNPVDTLPVGGV